jgi:hypothetical protein
MDMVDNHHYRSDHSVMPWYIWRLLRQEMLTFQEPEHLKGPGSMKPGSFFFVIEKGICK